jgi:hypothetical protein
MAFVKKRPRSLFELSGRIQNGEDATMLYGEFLDAFSGMSLGEMEEALAREPARVLPRTGANLAAMAEELATEQGLVPPAWSEKQKYFLPDGKAVYAGRPKAAVAAEVRGWLREQSPQSFARRNIFVSQNALARR